MVAIMERDKKTGLILPSQPTVNGKMLIIPEREIEEPTLPIERQWTKKEVQEILYITEMLRGPAGISAVMGLYGLPGSGKTAFLVWILYKLRKYFGMRSIIDSPYLKPAFGEYTLMMDRDYVRELRKIYKVTERYKNEGRLQELDWDAIDTVLYRSAFGWDESYSKISRRAASKNKLTEAYLDLLLQYRHFQCVVVMATPKESLIDAQKGSYGITHDVLCSCSMWVDEFGEERVVSKYSIRNRHTKRTTVKFLDIKKWSALFDSFGIIVPRTQFIKFKGIDMEDIDEDDFDKEKHKIKKQIKYEED